MEGIHPGKKGMGTKMETIRGKNPDTSEGSNISSRSTPFFRTEGVELHFEQGGKITQTLSLPPFFSFYCNIVNHDSNYFQSI